MPGDIKLATLSDTTVENIGVNSDELVTNAGFSADSDWTKGDGWTISGASALHIAGTAGDIDQPVSLLVGQAYTIIVNITTSDLSEFYFKLDDGNYIQIEGSPLGVHSYTFIASESIQNVGARGGVNWDGTVDNISVRATTELITNGDFSAGDDGSWSEGSESIATFTNNQLTISGTTVGGPFVYQILNLIAGQTYTFEFDIDSMTAATTAVYLGPSNNGIYVTSAGKYSYTFVYDTSMYPYLYLLCNNNGNVVFNSVSIRPAVDDRSVNNNGLQVIGEIDKTPVAPGADLVAYSGFSENDYLVQPYNEDLDFGTGDFCVMGWVKVSDMASSTYSLVYRSSEAMTGNYYHCSLNVGKLKFARHDGTAEDDLSGSTDLDNNTWHHFCGVYEGGDLKIYVDGRADADKVTAVNTSLVDDSSAF